MERTIKLEDGQFILTGGGHIVGATGRYNQWGTVYGADDLDRFKAGEIDTYDGNRVITRAEAEALGGCMYVIGLQYEGAWYFWRTEYQAPAGSTWIGPEGAGWGRLGRHTTVYKSLVGAEVVFPQAPKYHVFTWTEAQALEIAQAL